MKKMFSVLTAVLLGLTLFSVTACDNGSNDDGNSAGLAYTSTGAGSTATGGTVYSGSMTVNNTAYTTLTMQGDSSSGTAVLSGSGASISGSYARAVAASAATTVYSGSYTITFSFGTITVTFSGSIVTLAGGTATASGTGTLVVQTSGGSSGSTSSGTRVAAAGTAPAGFVAVDGRTGGAGIIVPMFACDHEVTQGEYETYCCYEGNIVNGLDSYQPTDRYGKGSSYPAYLVSWYGALVYCNLRSMAEGLTPCYSIGGSTDPASWPGIKSSGGKYWAGSPYGNDRERWDAATCNVSANGYRLPTKAEWLYLAKGGYEEKSYKYAGSNNIDDVAWYEGNSHDKTHEVKGKAPNSLGMYDMTGNVKEWCWDGKWSDSDQCIFRIYLGSYYGFPPNMCDFSSIYVGAGGGSWYSPNIEDKTTGFRVVRTAQ